MFHLLVNVLNISFVVKIDIILFFFHINKIVLSYKKKKVKEGVIIIS